MLAAGTMITVRKRQMEEHLGLTAELRVVFQSNPDEEADMEAIPEELRIRKRKSTVVTQRNSVASIVTKSRAKGDSPWTQNKVLAQLEKMVEDDTTTVTLQSLRDKIYFAFQGFPSSVQVDEPWPTLSNAIMIGNIVLVGISCFQLALTTVAQIAANDVASSILFAVETTSIAWFVFDYAVRFTTSRRKADFAMRLLNVVDLITIFPYFVDLVTSTNISALAALRVVRLSRVMRLTRLSRSSGGLRDVFTALANSGPALSLLGFLLIIAMFILSTFMYYAEQTEGAVFDYEARLWYRGDGRISQFQSVYHTMWFTIVTLSTVGYGDSVPVTVIGKIVGFITMLSGVLVIAFPTVILSASFHDAYSTRLTYMTLQKIAQLNGRLSKGDIPTIGRQRAAVEESVKPASPEQSSSPPSSPRVVVGEAEKWKRRHTLLQPQATQAKLAAQAAKSVIFFPHHQAYAEQQQEDLSRVPLECEFANPADYDRAMQRIARASSFKKLNLGNSTAADMLLSRSDMFASFRQTRKTNKPDGGSGENVIPLLAVGMDSSNPTSPRHAEQSLRSLDDSTKQKKLHDVLHSCLLTNRSAQSEDIIINGVLFYSPILQFQCVPLTNIIQARVMKTFPAGYTLTVHLLLDSEVVRSVYEAQYVPEAILKMKRAAGIGVIDGKKVEVRDTSKRDPLTRRLQRAALRMGKVHSVAAKKVKSIVVKLGHSVPQPDGDVVSQCYMAVDTFDNPPVSVLPLTVVAPSNKAFRALLDNFELLTFSFEVDYQEPQDVELGFGNMKSKSVVRTERAGSIASECGGANPLAGGFARR